MDRFEQFLDEGGTFVIRKNGPRMLVIPEICIENTKYHCGITFKSTDDFKNRLDFFAGCGIAGLKRKKKELSEEFVVCAKCGIFMQIPSCDKPDSSKKTYCIKCLETLERESENEKNM